MSSPTPPQPSNTPGWILAIVAAILFAIGTFHASPAPDPGPGPKPPVPFDPAGTYLVAIVDNDNKTPEQALLLHDKDLGDWLVQHKIGWHVLSKDGSEFKQDGYDKILTADGLTAPAVVLVSKDRTSHRSIAAPATADALKQWVLGNPHTGPPSIMANGEMRMLTCLPPSQARLMAPRGGEWRDSANPTLPRSKWKEVNNRNLFPADAWVFDQDGIGSCVANGAAVALMKTRHLSGMTDVRLAPGNLYSQVNGGHDNGAVISDSLAAMQQTGVLSAATLGSDEKPFYTRQQPSGWKTEANRFRVEEAYHLANYDEIASAIQLGWVVVYGVQVGNNFNSFTPDGVAGHSSGPGNHCMHADGLHQVQKNLPLGASLESLNLAPPTASTSWVLDNQNSWGVAWGPWKNGRCYLSEDHFLHGDQPDAYAIRTAVEDPKDPKKPPVPKSDPKKHASAALPCGKTSCDCGCPDKTCKCANDVAKQTCSCDGNKKSCKCSPGTCECSPCADKLPNGIKRAVKVWQWKHTDDVTQDTLYADGVLVGAWRFDKDKFYSLDSEANVSLREHWTEAECPVKKPLPRMRPPATIVNIQPFTGYLPNYCPPSRS